MNAAAAACTGRPAPPLPPLDRRPDLPTPTACRVFKCALVCKRWHELVTTEPQLLQSLELQASSDSASNGRFSSLLRFLSAAAPHVRQLSLSLEARGHYTGSEMRQLAAHLHTCLARCTQLESLSLRLGSVPCTLGPWLAPLAGSLRRLELEYKISVPGSDNTLRLEPEGLAACTQLEALALIGSAVWLQAPVAGCWPAGITSLELRLSWLSELPTSVSLLCCRGCSGRGRHSVCTQACWLQCTHPAPPCPAPSAIPDPTR